MTDHERKDIYSLHISDYKAKIKDGFKKLYGVSGKLLSCRKFPFDESLIMAVSFFTIVGVLTKPTKAPNGAKYANEGCSPSQGKTTKQP